MSDGTLDPAALGYLLEITGGDEAFLDDLVQTFLGDADDQLAALRAAAAEGSVDALVRPSHSLKSSAANVGATRLSELSRALEADARAGAVEAPSLRVEAIAAEATAVRLALQEVRGTGGG